MRVQIVQDQMEFAHLGIDLPCQIPHEFHKVLLGPPASHFHLAVAGLGLHRHEQVSRAGPLVFIIFLGDLAWSCRRQWPPGLFQQLFALFVQANHRFSRVVRLGIKPQQLRSVLYLAVIRPIHHITLRQGLQTFFLESAGRSPG